MAVSVAVPAEVLLVRHAQPQPDGTLDPGLSDDGRLQSQALVEHLEGVPLAAVYSSHLKRAAETAAPLAAARGLEVRIDEGLREWKSNATHYAGTENLADPSRLIAFLEGRFEEGFVPPHNAEELRATMVATIRRIGLDHQGERIVAVSHGGATNTFLAEVVGSPRRFFFNPGYASISRVQVWPDGRIVLVSINEPVDARAQHTSLLPGG
ncbi:MAG: histidine phosphatase family protein [Actinomycetales bacterium]|nr:histidine phosphatase family protein [Actinomycetales bacterium]